MKIGYYHIRSLGGRGRIVRKVEKDGVYPQPLFVETISEHSSKSGMKDLLGDGVGVSPNPIVAICQELIDGH